MFCSLKVLTTQNGFFISKCSCYGIQIHEASLVLDEDRDMPRTCQFSARGIQDLDLRPKLEPSARDEADSHLQLPCFTTLDFPERNAL